MEILLIIIGIFWFAGAIYAPDKKRQDAIRQQNMDELVENLNNEYRNK